MRKPKLYSVTVAKDNYLTIEYHVAFSRSELLEKVDGKVISSSIESDSNYYNYLTESKALSNPSIYSVTVKKETSDILLEEFMSSLRKE